MISTGELLRQRFGLENLPNVKIARSLLSLPMRLYFLFYDTHRPQRPVTTTRIMEFPHVAQAYRFDLDTPGSFAPPINLDTFNGPIDRAVFVLVDFAGEMLADPDIYSRPHQESQDDLAESWESAGFWVLTEEGYTIKDLKRHAATPHEKKFYKIRKQLGRSLSELVDVSWNRSIHRAEPTRLTITFRTTPTYDDKVKVVTTKGVVKTGRNYTVRVQFQDVEGYLGAREEFMALSPGDQSDFMYMLIRGAPVKLYSNDMSWLFQGSFENAAEMGYSIYPFPSVPHQQGTWAQIKTGHTSAPNFTLSKHTLEALDYMMQRPIVAAICRMLRDKYGAST